MPQSTSHTETCSVIPNPQTLLRSQLLSVAVPNKLIRVPFVLRGLPLDLLIDKAHPENQKSRSLVLFFPTRRLSNPYRSCFASTYFYFVALPLLLVPLSCHKNSTSANSTHAFTRTCQNTADLLQAFPCLLCVWPVHWPTWLTGSYVHTRTHKSPYLERPRSFRTLSTNLQVTKRA